MSDVQKQLYGIAIFEEEIVLSDFTGEGERRFIVSPEQLMAFVRTDVTFRPSLGSIWMKTDGAAETHLLTLPAAERVILYRRGHDQKNRDLHELRLRLPAIAVKATVDAADRKITSIGMWGFTGKTLQADSVLYELPLPNLSGSSLCLGSTERAAAGDCAFAVERTIFDTPFNHHNHLVGKGKLPFHDYVARYQGCCPVKTLNVIGHGRDILGGAR